MAQRLYGQSPPQRLSSFSRPAPRDPFADRPIAGPLSSYDVAGIISGIRDASSRVRTQPARTGISDSENAEIDAAIAEQESRAERIAALADFKSTIHPDRLLDLAGNIAAGRRVGPPEPRTPPDERPVDVRTQPVAGSREIISMGPATRTQPDLLPTESGDQSMDLSSILSGVAGVTQAYANVVTARNPTTSLNDGGYTGSARDWLDGPTDWLDNTQGGSVVATVPAGGAMGCISQRDREIAARSGVSPEAVDRVLKASRYGRRRRRCITTKSDIRGIAAMKQVLGNGEAFKLWLAKNC